MLSYVIILRQDDEDDFVDDDDDDFRSSNGRWITSVALTKLSAILVYTQLVMSGLATPHGLEPANHSASLWPRVAQSIALGVYYLWSVSRSSDSHLSLDAF